MAVNENKKTKNNSTTLVEGLSENFSIMYTNDDSLPNKLEELKP